MPGESTIDKKIVDTGFQSQRMEHPINTCIFCTVETDMNLVPTSMNLPRFPHPFSRVGYFDSRTIYRDYNIPTGLSDRITQRRFKLADPTEQCRVICSEILMSKRR